MPGWNQLGHLYQRIGELAQAESIYKIILDLAGNDSVWQAATYGNLGNVYGIRGDLDKAVEFYEKALVLFTEVGAKNQMAQVQSLLDKVHQTRTSAESVD